MYSHLQRRAEPTKPEDGYGGGRGSTVRAEGGGPATRTPEAAIIARDPGKHAPLIGEAPPSSFAHSEHKRAKYDLSCYHIAVISISTASLHFQGCYLQQNGCTQGAVRSRSDSPLTEDF